MAERFRGRKRIPWGSTEADGMSEAPKVEIFERGSAILGDWDWDWDRPVWMEGIHVPSTVVGR